jgi:hypothetical protein
MAPIISESPSMDPIGSVQNFANLPASVNVGTFDIESPIGSAQSPLEMADRSFHNFEEMQLLRLKPRSTWPPEKNGANGHTESIVSRSLTFPRPLTATHHQPHRASEGAPGSLRNQRKRGKFSDARRKEVLGVRKKGACIRCRMLRKTVLMMICHVRVS